MATSTSNTAKALEKKIFNNSKNVQKHIKKFVDIEGFKTLGFNSLKEWVTSNKDKLSMSYDSLNNHLHAAEITVLMGDEPGKYFTYSILPLKGHTKKSVKSVVKEAKKYHGVNELTDTHFTAELTQQFIDNLGLNELSSPEVNFEPPENNKNLINEESDCWIEEDGSDEDIENFELDNTQQKLVAEMNNSNSKSTTYKLGKAISATFSKNRQLKVCRTILSNFDNTHIKDLVQEINKLIIKI